MNIMNSIKGFYFTIAFALLSFISFAQDSTSTVNTTIETTGTKSTTTETWYTQPWMWIVGGAVLILLIIALMRGGNKNSAS